MRTIPIPNNTDLSWQSMTAAELITELQKLDANTVIMTGNDSEVIVGLQPDTSGFDIVYLISR